MPGNMRCRAAIAGQVSCPWYPRRGSARGRAGSLLTRVTLVVRSQLDPAVLAQVRGRLEGLVRQTVAAWADDPSLDSTEACVVAEFDAADSGFVPAISFRCSPTRRPWCWAIPGSAASGSAGAHSRGGGAGPAPRLRRAPD